MGMEHWQDNIGVKTEVFRGKPAQCIVSTTNPTWTVFDNIEGFHLEVQQRPGDLQDWCFVADSVWYVV